jgi:hypothetical protein
VDEVASSAPKAPTKAGKMVGHAAFSGAKSARTPWAPSETRKEESSHGVHGVIDRVDGTTSTSPPFRSSSLHCGYMPAIGCIFGIQHIERKTPL